MRKPPSVYRPVRGGQFEGELTQVLKSIEQAMIWIAEVVEEIKPSRHLDDCPASDCGQCDCGVEKRR